MIESEISAKSGEQTIPHALYRVDDNGVSALIDTFPSRADAAKRMQALESTGHKQTYWIESLRSS